MQITFHPRISETFSIRPNSPKSLTSICPVAKISTLVLKPSYGSLVRESDEWLSDGDLFGWKKRTLILDFILRTSMTSFSVCILWVYSRCIRVNDFCIEAFLFPRNLSLNHIKLCRVQMSSWNQVSWTLSFSWTSHIDWISFKNNVGWVWLFLRTQDHTRCTGSIFFSFFEIS